MRRHEVRGVAHKVSVYLFGNCESARQLRFGSGQSKIRDTGRGCAGSNAAGFVCVGCVDSPREGEEASGAGAQPSGDGEREDTLIEDLIEDGGRWCVQRDGGGTVSMVRVELPSTRGQVARVHVGAALRGSGRQESVPWECAPGGGRRRGRGGGRRGGSRCLSISWVRRGDAQVLHLSAGVSGESWAEGRHARLVLRSIGGGCPGGVRERHVQGGGEVVDIEADEWELRAGDSCGAPG